MPSYRLHASPDALGWRFDLRRRSRLPFAREAPMALADWAAAPDQPGVALLLALLDGGDASGEGAGLRLTHARTAALTRGEAVRLGLPPPAPFALFLSHEAPVTDPDFSLRVQWFRRGGQPVQGGRREGTRLIAEGREFLVLEPLYSALEGIESVNGASGDESADGLDRRMAAFCRFKDHLTRLTGDMRADDYLRGLTIHQATGLGIDLEPGEGTPFLPTLYGDRPGDASQGDGEGIEPEREPLLPRQQAGQFQTRFRDQGARSHYVLGKGVYTVLDPPVAAALAVVERVNGADPETRRSFRDDPLSFLAPAIEAAGGDASVLCELRGYGPRVTGVGAWAAPSFSFPLPVSRDWFPAEELEVYRIDLGDGTALSVPVEQVTDYRRQVEEALTQGRANVSLGGHEVPVSEALAETLRGLVGRMPAAPRAADTETKGGKTPPTVLLTKDNEERLTYLRERRRLQGVPPAGLPVGLRMPPKPHQETGIAWLQAGYLAGAPGLVLADDMGLGKTYQVLAFLLWLRGPAGGDTRSPKPVLIVAPKTLLGTWREELAQHLGEGALGREVHAYEGGLNDLRLGPRAGNDIALGRQTLDTEAIASAGLVLTTYETLRDYQLSFAKVCFAVAVFDEAQKIKNPASLMNRGAKAQQGDFNLILTGTPIENTVLDLWTLLDIAWPGLLGLSARDFLKRYGGEDPAARAELKARLTEPPGGSTGAPDPSWPLPPVLLRRFKQELLKGLPERRVEVLPEPMPPGQRAAYDAVVAEVRDRPGATLEGLQRLRAVSLHPGLGQDLGSGAGDADFIAASARFRRLFEVLDRVHQAREKVLIFVDLREAQTALYDLIRRRYRLPAPRPEAINGATVGPIRDRIRQAFQARLGFDVLLLGPKAAGFGLTLTAANHVVHLNRWWNPAVEDQCSDRVYRIGQVLPVTIYLPQAIHPDLGERCFDGQLHALLEEKRCLSRELVVPVQFSDGDMTRLFAGSLGGSDSGGAAVTRVDSLDWRGFEHWVAEQLRAGGFAVDLTPGRGDGGADLIATRGPGRAVLIQCKHRARGSRAVVDEAAVDDLLRARDLHRARHPDPLLVAVSNGRFTLAARKRAEAEGVRFVDGLDVSALGARLAGLL